MLKIQDSQFTSTLVWERSEYQSIIHSSQFFETCQRLVIDLGLLCLVNGMFDAILFLERAVHVKYPVFSRWKLQSFQSLESLELGFWDLGLPWNQFCSDFLVAISCFYDWVKVHCWVW